MPTKGELTRQRVIERSAPVFNQRGYWGASLRAVMDATGLEKGGIYNHFSSKDELALAAFDHNVGLLGELVRGALDGKHHAVDRLLALNEAYRAFALERPLSGGCPILNAAVDSDDTHPQIRARVRQAMSDLREGTVARIIERGIERGELPSGTDPDAVATVIVSTLEGALLLAQLYEDPRFVEQAAAHLDEFVVSLAPPKAHRQEDKP